MIQTAFNAGEITPLAHGRPDLAVYPAGCETLSGFRSLLHGGITRDPGLEHLGTPQDNRRPRLLPFEFSTSQRFVLEFTAYLLRFWTTGTTPAVLASTAVTPYPEADLRDIHTAQLNDLLILTHGSHPIQRLTRTATDTFSWAAFTFLHPPLLDQNTDKTHTLTFDGASTLTSTDALFDASHVGAVFELAHLRTTAQREIYYDLDSGSDPHTTGSIIVDGTATFSTKGVWSARITVQQSDDGSSGWEDLETFKSEATANFEEEITTDGRKYLRLYIEDRNTTIGDSDVRLTSVDRYLRGLLQITGYSSSTSVTVSEIVDTQTTATDTWSEGAFSGYQGYPAAVTYHRQRIYFAGTTRQPQKIWASRIDAFDDFRRPAGLDSTSEADAPFVLDILSTSQNRITFLSSQRELIVGTSAGEWIVAGDQQTGALGPGSYYITPLSSYGTQPLQPLAPETGLVFLQRGGRILRHIPGLADAYLTPQSPPEELTLYGEHLCRPGLLEHTYQRTPDPIYWAINADGLLIGYTHKPTQKVLAWHRHPLGDTVQAESLAATYSDYEEDQLFLALAHTAPDGSVTRTIERFALGQREAQEAGDFASFRSLHHHRTATATAGVSITATGLNYLAGRTLTWTLDGIPHHTEEIPTSGTLTWTPPASGAVSYGIHLEGAATILPAVPQTETGPHILKTSQIGTMRLLVWKTYNARLSCSGSGANGRTVGGRPVTDPLTGLPALHTGTLQADGIGNHSDRPTITITTPDPFPATILALQYDLLPTGQ